MSASEDMLKKAGYKRSGETQIEGLGAVLQEYDVLSAQASKRREFLEKIESFDGKGTSGVLAFISSEAGTIDSDDIPAFGDALQTVGDVGILYLIIDSPGGDGTVAEKIIKLCRSYCSKLIVVVPNRAKSAATIIALGADEIIMGFCSEIGPIDAQIPVIVDGWPHFVSAHSFISAKTSLEAQFKECLAKNEDPRAILQQIATLNPAFIQHCERLMNFGKDVVRKCLSKHMFSSERKADRKAKIDRVIERLSAVQRFQVHGRMIDGNAAKTELGLKVNLLGKDHDLWNYIWGYYLRAYVFLGRFGFPAAKMVETKKRLLVKQPAVVADKSTG
jgi:membrane-bound ClpP family serine protease